MQGCSFMEHKEQRGCTNELCYSPLHGLKNLEGMPFPGRAAWYKSLMDASPPLSILADWCSQSSAGHHNTANMPGQQWVFNNSLSYWVTAYQAEQYSYPQDSEEEPDRPFLTVLSRQTLLTNISDVSRTGFIYFSVYLGIKLWKQVYQTRGKQTHPTLKSCA